MTESLDDKHTLERKNFPSQSPLNLVADVIAIFFLNGCKMLSLVKTICSHRWGCMAESYQAEGSLCDWSY